MSYLEGPLFCILSLNPTCFTFRCFFYMELVSNFTLLQIGGKSVCRDYKSVILSNNKIPTYEVIERYSIRKQSCCYYG